MCSRDRVTISEWAAFPLFRTGCGVMRNFYPLLPRSWRGSAQTLSGYPATLQFPHRATNSSPCAPVFPLLRRSLSIASQLPLFSHSFLFIFFRQWKVCSTKRHHRGLPSVAYRESLSGPRRQVVVRRKAFLRMLRGELCPRGTATELTMLHAGDAVFVDRLIS